MTKDDLRAIREDLGLTQQEMADRLGVDRVTVARWETGARAITSVTALAIKAMAKKRKSK